MSDDGLFRDPCWSAACECGWNKSIPLSRGGSETTIGSKARKHQRSAGNYYGKQTDRVAMRWHQDHPGFVVRTFKAIRLRCRFCDYTSDPCETMSDLRDAIDEHVSTTLHRDAMSARRLANAVAQKMT